MDEKYFRLWILFKEQIAKRAKEAAQFTTEKDMYTGLLEDMVILEAEVILED